MADKKNRYLPHVDGLRAVAVLVVLLFHLGMSGRMVCVTPPDEDFDKHDHVVFQTAKGQVRFNDPRRFGFVEMYSGPDSNSRFLDQLGPEPLSDALNLGHMRSVFKDKSAPIKASLLNQRRLPVSEDGDASKNRRRQMTS